MKSEAFPGESGLAVGASLRCFVFHYLELGWGSFIGKIRLKIVFAPSLFLPGLRCFVFQHLGLFLQNVRFQSGFVVGLVIPCVLSREIRHLFLLC